MFSIIAKLGLDSTGFRVGVKQAEGALGNLNSSLNGQMKAQLAGAFGVGALVA